MSKIQPYSEKKMKLLRDYLLKEAQEGRPRYYEIKIDGIKVVPRTNDPVHFESYLETLEDDNNLIEVMIYQTSERSFNSDKYQFQISDNSGSNKNTLSGSEVDAKIQSAVERERERMENEKVREELEKTKSDLKEAEEHIEKLQEDLKKYQGKKLHWGNVNLGELASVMVEGMVRRNPQILTKLPGGETLAGIIEQDNKEREQETETEDAEVTIIKNTSDNKELSEDQKRFLQVLEMLEDNFDEGELMLITSILSKLIERKHDLKTVASLLDIPMKH